MYMAKKSSIRKFVSLMMVSFLVFLSLPSQARTNASLVELISGSQEDLNLFILDRDIELNLADETARLRMLMDAKDLLVQNSYPQSFKVKTYTFDSEGQKVIQSTVSHTVRRRNRSRVKFTIDLGYVEGDEDFYFDLYDSADRLVNTYRQTIDFSNLQEQVADTTPIAAADCDNTSFNECHLDYIMEKINFLLEPKNTNYSNKIKKPNGSYDVVLSIPKSVKEQVLRGNFNFQAAGLGALGGSNGDNLGNHEATQDLNMRHFDIYRVNDIGTANITVGQELYVANGAYLDHLKMEDNGSISIPNGAANGYVLTSDANGNATWQSLSAAMNGDNLGNHMATQDLDMKGFNIVNADTLAAESVNVNGSLAFKTGAVDGYVLTSDSNGNGHWRPVSTVVNGDGLGNHRADINLDMNGNSIVAAQQINADTLVANIIEVTTVDVGAQIHSPTLHGTIDVNGELLIPDGAAAGKVLTSDANGTASWQLAQVSNYSLPTDLTLSDLEVLNLTELEDIEINGDLMIQNGAGLGKVLTSDANGNASWQVASGGAGDNLGDHIADHNLYMNGHSLDFVGGLNMLIGSETGNGTINISWLNKNLYEVNLNGNATLTFTSNPGYNANLVLVVNQDAVGGRTLTYPALVKWPGGVAPSLTTNGNALDVIDCLYLNSSANYMCDLREADYR